MFKLIALFSLVFSATFVHADTDFRQELYNSLNVESKEVNGCSDQKYTQKSVGGLICEKSEEGSFQCYKDPQNISYGLVYESLNVEISYRLVEESLNVEPTETGDTENESPAIREISTKKIGESFECWKIKNEFGVTNYLCNFSGIWSSHRIELCDFEPGDGNGVVGGWTLPFPN